MRVLIVGSGILGASIAYHLAQRNVSLSMLHDPDLVPSTNGSFGWINANGPDDPDYFRLRLKGVEAWHKLVQDIPDLPVQLHGGLDWDLDVEASYLAYQALGQPCELLDRVQIKARFPFLGAAPKTAIFNSREGLADPDRIAGALLDAAGPLSEIIGRVKGFDTTNGRITGIQTAERTVKADHVVLAAGLQTERLLATLDIPLPMHNELGILFRTNPVSPQLPQVISTPGLHFWQMPDGTLLAGEDLGGADVGRGMPELQQRILDGLHRFLPKAGPISLSETRQTKRPMPADGRPAVGQVCDGLSVACTHSGITLALILGEAIAQEITQSDPMTLFKPYSPKRFQAHP